MNYEVEGRTVIVTGGGSGIGRACVQLLLDEGCNVVAASRSEAAGVQLIAELDPSAEKRIRFIPTDVADEAAVASLVKQTVDAFGRLDGAINAAGIPPAGYAVHELSDEIWQARTGINLTGMFYCLKHQIAAMRQSGRGSIVAVTSAGGERSLPFSAEYSAAKAGVHSMVRSAALENARAGIRLNSILPGPIDTPMFARALADNPSLEDIADATPMARVGRPQEVAHGALWLLSDASSFVTGVSLPIDGGSMLR